MLKASENTRALLFSVGVCLHDQNCEAIYKAIKSTPNQTFKRTCKIRALDS